MPSSIFINNLRAGIYKVHVYFDNVMVIGDLNYDVNAPQKSQPLQSICDILDYSNLVTKQTCFYYKKKPPSILGVILTNKPNLMFNVTNVMCGISDSHNIISVAIKGDAPPPKHRKIKYRSFKNVDEDAFSEAVGAAPFEVAYVFDDVDDIYWAHEVLFTDLLI